MDITIKLNTDNAAFDDSNETKEIARILSEVQLLIANGYKPNVLRDINGNRCGTVEYEGDDTK